ncbi:hypothetical protein [Gordonia sp. (in: high G+C Gram-positive bacteria)]|uniref:hypothetical protein n=1 Tax=Gordonia sp. (in: high G+C Gram-positive bacteria) TaxID=84139 RepID=UPI003F9A018B
MTVCDEAVTSGGASGETVTVGDLLEPTGLTAFLDTPVADVLHDLGLPTFDAPMSISLPDLSDLGLPALPSLPGLDPTALVKPIVDLFGTFGTGSLSGANSPIESLGSLAGLLQSGASTLLNATSNIDADWAGQAATAAIGTAVRTAGQSEQIAAQGTAMAADVQAAATIVGAGLVQLQGVVAKTVGLLTAAAPTLVTPAGQVAALGIAAEGLTEGLAVVADTRAQLTAPTAHISAVGTPVAVSDAPIGLSGDMLSTALRQAGPLFDAGVEFVGGILGVGGDPSTAQTTGTDPMGTTGAPATATAGACCVPGDRTAALGTTGTAATGGTTTAGNGTAGNATPSMRPTAIGIANGGAGTGTGVGAVTSGATPSVDAGQALIELADRPVTSNASMTTGEAGTGSTGNGPTGSGAAGSGVPASHTASPVGGIPMTPMAASGAARPVDDTGLRLTDSSTAVDEPTRAAGDPVDELAALLAQPFGTDVGLRLDAGHADLAGSV